MWPGDQAICQDLAVTDGQVGERQHTAWREGVMHRWEQQLGIVNQTAPKIEYTMSY